jgi:hypothetical protein
MMVIKPVVEYQVAQFMVTDRVFAKGLDIPNTKLVKFINSGTGCHTHVDVCLYGVLVSFHILQKSTLLIKIL